MKVLMLNGSSHINGTTMAALTEVGKALEEDGIEYEIFQIGGGPVADCLGCGQCTENGCIFSDDAVNAFVAKAKEADGYIFGTPVYYAHPSGRIQSFLDRVFYSSGGVLPTSRELRSQLRDVVVQRQHLMFLINISVSRR